jgi:hypothetical protein
MKKVPICTLLLGLVFSTPVFADGHLKYSLNGDMGFMVLEVHEHHGATSGQLRADWGGYSAHSYVDGDTLHMVLDNLRHYLKFEPSPDGKMIYYSGRIWSNRFSTIKAYPNPKDGLRIQGEIVDNAFKYSVDQKKQTLFLEWQDMTLDAKAVQGTPGKITGKLYSNMVTAGTFVSESSGSLENAFLRDPNAIIAWLIQMLVMPIEEARF